MTGPKSAPLGARLLTHIATLGPIGHIPIAPGTMGTLATAAFVWTVPLPPPQHWALALFITALGTWASTVSEGVLGKHDPGSVVIDECAGYLLATALIDHTPLSLISAFVLFRFLDIIKPLGIKGLQRLPGGWGVMADDVVAGLAAGAMIHVASLSIQAIS